MYNQKTNNMEKLTKKQRHIEYKRTLNDLEQWYFICTSLMRKGINYEDINSRNFPEFFMFKPKRKNTDNTWFENTLEREIVLDLCIEMTK